MRFTLVVSDYKYHISVLSNFTFYKLCVTKVAHCNEFLKLNILNDALKECMRTVKV